MFRNICRTLQPQGAKLNGKRITFINTSFLIADPNILRGTAPNLHAPLQLEVLDRSLTLSKVIDSDEFLLPALLLLEMTDAVVGDAIVRTDQVELAPAVDVFAGAAMLGLLTVVM